MDLTGKSIIGYAQGAEGAATYQGVNASTGEKLEPKFHSASPAEVSRAAELAARAFTEYSGKSGKERAAFLRAIAAKLETHVEVIVARATAETALPAARIQGETGRTTGQLRLFADLIEDGTWLMARIDRGNPDRKPAPKPDVRSMLRPLGPVVVFGASNFPLAFSVAGGDTASALASGCPVIAMAPSGHPGTAELAGAAIRDAAKECGMPEGTFSLLFSVGHENGMALVAHPAIKACGFTGSRKGGRVLFDIAQHEPTPIPFYAEMSSINPVFVLSGALKTRAEELAKGLNGSITMGVGQFCTCPGIIVMEKSAEARKLTDMLSELQQAAPAASMLHFGIREAYQRGIETLAGRPGVATLAKQAPTGISMVSPALFETDANAFLVDGTIAAEIFGPSSTIVTHGSRDELMKIANSLEGQLTATIHGTVDDLATHADLIVVLEQKAGRLLFNGFPTGVEVCHAMVHGGPYPATSDGRSTSVGTQSIYRFTRPVCYQAWPDSALPAELQDANPLRVWRLMDGQTTRDSA